MSDTDRWTGLARTTGWLGLVGALLLFAPIIAISTLGEPELHASEADVVAFFDTTAAACGWLTLDTGVLPRWTGWLAVIAAVGFVITRFFWTSSAWTLPYAVFWVWLLAVCVLLLRRPARVAPAT